MNSSYKDDCLIRWDEIEGFEGLKEHNERVSILSYQLALAINLEKKACEEIKYAGKFHDVGKLFIPLNILNKPSKLNEYEFDYMKNHSLYTYLFLKHCGLNENICNIAKLHHESLDGSGYPFKMKGEDIPIGSRILKICDVFDALTNDRIYRSKFSKEEALSIMDKENTKYDPFIFNIFKLYADNIIQKIKCARI